MNRELTLIENCATAVSRYQPRQHTLFSAIAMYSLHFIVVLLSLATPGQLLQQLFFFFPQ